METVDWIHISPVSLVKNHVKFEREKSYQELSELAHSCSGELYTPVQGPCEISVANAIFYPPNWTTLKSSATV